MACSRGRANPSTQTKLRLFADSAGYCSRPDCHRPLFGEEGQADYHIGEMAHILAARDGGPRTASDVERQDRASYNNLILLCPNCHSEVDKCPEQFPDSLLHEWKRHHKDTISRVVGVQTVSSRDEAFSFVEPLLRSNILIHQQYGPENDYRENPEAEEAPIWKRKMVDHIIPNNQKVLLFLDRNLHLVHEDERRVVELFRQHIDDLVERHLGHNQRIASRFPSGMNKLFGGT